MHRLGLLLPILPVLAGCVVTVEHIVPPMTALTFDERLLGTWQNGEKARATVTRDHSGDYRIRYRNGRSDGVTQFLARTGRLGARPVLEVWPDPDALDDNDNEYTGLVAPGIMLLAVGFDSTGVRLAGLDQDSIKAAIRERRLRLRRSDHDDPLVLLGSPRELRTALQPWIARAPFTDADHWVRAAPEPGDTLHWTRGASGASDSTIDSLRNVVDLVLRAIGTGDSALLRRLTLPSTVWHSTRGYGDSARFRTSLREEFIAAIGRAGTSYLERIWLPEIEVTGGIAVLRAPYDFWINGVFSHCGVDRFTLVRAEGEWKLAHLGYNVQDRGCSPSPLGPPGP